jgi:hypothetical protein
MLVSYFAQAGLITVYGFLLVVMRLRYLNAVSTSNSAFNRGLSAVKHSIRMFLDASLLFSCTC